MAQAVTHFIIPALLMALFRDYYLRKRDKKHFPLHYVLAAGLGGVLPDIDLVLYFILQLLGTTPDYNHIHGTLTHTLLFPLLIFLIAPLTKGMRIKKWCTHELKVPTLLLMLAFGITTHIGIDLLTHDSILPFYPLSETNYAHNFPLLFPAPLNHLFLPFLDGILLVLWIIYLEVRHKISDFI